MPRSETKGTPLRLDPGKLAGKGLDEFPPLPNQPEGTSGHRLDGLESSGARGSMLYEGDVVVQVAEMEPCKMQLVDHQIDEFVQVLAGSLIYTSDKGEIHEFGPGDCVIVPKGFTGSRENKGDPYRELVIIETKTFEAAMEELTKE